jgi:homoserine kinase
MSCKVTVKVPATTANLGPGFDSLGMALDLWNEFEVTVDLDAANETSGGGLRLVDVVVEGEGAGALPADSNNLVYKALKAGFTGEEPPRASAGWAAALRQSWAGSWRRMRCAARSSRRRG